ncbi:TetR/AcrR family transcriptional regulator [Gordonia sp. NPDC003376]
MTQDTPKVNRGPAAGAENRARLLSAARIVFAERGYAAPLSAVAKEAGVGQAVLYRHFPTKLDLAYAVFNERWDEYERIAANPGPDAFPRMWSLIIEHTIDNVAFIEMVADTQRNMPSGDTWKRLRNLLQNALAASQAAGTVDPELTVRDVMLAHRMVYGIVASAVDHSRLRADVIRALSIAGRMPPLDPGK